MDAPEPLTATRAPVRRPAVVRRLAQKDGRIGRAIWAHIGFNATTIIILLLPVPTI